MAWAQFWDMHSGGRQKLDWPQIFIETIADEDDGAEREAISIFYAKFGRNPTRVTCTCCGEDYSISVAPTLREATAYQRGCGYDSETQQYIEQQGEKTFGHKYQSLDDYIASDEVKVIYKDEVDDGDRELDPPAEGFVWVG